MPRHCREFATENTNLNRQNALASRPFESYLKVVCLGLMLRFIQLLWGLRTSGPSKWFGVFQLGWLVSSVGISLEISLPSLACCLGYISAFAGLERR